jgi:hypothetical protein
MLRNKICQTLAAIFLLLAAPAAATTLLPNGEQVFVDQNGVPYAGGSVYMYQPGTTTPKNTWKDSGQVTLNANPVVLDSAGRAIIYGSGCYQQALFDVNNNAIWSQLTCATDSNATIFGGTSGGSANAQTVSATAFSSTDGQTICFKAGNTNTGAVTLTANAVTVNVDRDTGAGPIATTGGEFILNNDYCVVYDLGANIFHIVGSAMASGLSNNNPIAKTNTSVSQTIDLGLTGSQYITLSGSSPNTITSFGSTASTTNPIYTIKIGAASNFTIVNNSTSLKVMGGVNYQVVGGEVIHLLYLGSGNWLLYAIDPPSGAGVRGLGNVRQTVTGGPYDTNGLPTFLPATTGNLNITSQNLTSTPMTVNFGNGVTSEGYENIGGLSAANLTWSGLTASQTNWLYVTPDGSGGLVAGTNFTILAPIYQYGGTPSSGVSITNGQFTFVINQNAMYLGNGAAAVLTPAVFVGQAITNGSSVTSTIAFVYNGRYHPAAVAVQASAGAVTAQCNIGTNVGVYALVYLVNVTTDLGYVTGNVAVANPVTFGIGASIMDGIKCKVNYPAATSIDTWSLTSPGTAATLTAAADWSYQLDVWRNW